MEILSKQKNKIYKNSRHIRWNWEQSPENLEMIRCHYVIVDDKNRKGSIEKILDYARKRSIINLTFEAVRPMIEGKVEGTKFRYLFVSYDTQYNPQFVDPKKIFKEVVKDSDLYERNKSKKNKLNLGIEEYVANFYG